MSSPDLGRNIGADPNVEIKPGTIESVFWRYCQQLGITFEQLETYIEYYLEAAQITTMGILFPVSTLMGDKTTIRGLHSSLVGVMRGNHTGSEALKKYDNRVPIPPIYDDCGYAHPILRLPSTIPRIEKSRIFTLRFIAETRMTSQDIKNKRWLTTYISWLTDLINQPTLA